MVVGESDAQTIWRNMQMSACVSSLLPPVRSRSRTPEEPKQEVARLSHLALPIRRFDLLFSACAVIKSGQEEGERQETAVR